MDEPNVEHRGLNKETVVPNLAPHLEMKFANVDEAWKFWVEYGGHVGFEVRKRYKNARKSDGKVTSCRYVCSNEGHRTRDKRDHLIKLPRAETRTECEVRMGLKMDGEVGYAVYDLVLEHNHHLHLPQTSHLMVSQRKILEVRAFEIETANDSEIGPKAAHELACRQVGGSLNLSYTRRDHKNYVRTKREREMAYGEAGSMLKYFQDKIIENPSFQYGLLINCEEQIANVFWADAKMLVDYAHFGDVVTFDTIFGTNKESRSFGVFVEFNHFRETVIFGAALLYSETFESFKWLFETFVAAHNGKKPRTIFTDQDFAMGKAVEKVFLEAWHWLCTFHIMQMDTRAQAVNSPECFMLVANTIGSLSKQVEDQNNASRSTSEGPCKVQKDVQAPNDVLRNACLKKKKVPTRGSKQKRNWLDKKCMAGKKGHNKTTSEVRKSVARNETIQAQVEDDNTLKDSKKGFEEYRVIGTFTQLLTGPNMDDLKTEELFP